MASLPYSHRKTALAEHGAISKLGRSEVALETLALNRARNGTKLSLRLRLVNRQVPAALNTLGLPSDRSRIHMILMRQRLTGLQW